MKGDSMHAERHSRRTAQRQNSKKLADTSAELAAKSAAAPLTLVHHALPKKT
jgi:hypothetical protein